MNVKAIPPEKVITGTAEKMKAMEEFKPPEWSVFVKTGSHKERPPQDPDWWWIRSAAVLKKLATKGTLGTSRLKKEYGGRKNKGHKPEHKYSASGSVIRKILQQLEAAGFIEKNRKGGRTITSKGTSFLALSAKGVKVKNK